MKDEKRLRLSADVLRICRNQLFFELRFMESALFRLKAVPLESFSFGSDGENLYYGAEYLLRRYYEHPDQAACDYIHAVLHCLFRHVFQTEKAPRKFWDLASDIAVAEIIRELGIPEISACIPQECFRIIDQMEKNVPLMEASKIAVYLQKISDDFEQIYGVTQEEVQKLFLRDCHDPWYPQSEETQQERGKTKSGEPRREDDKGEGQAEEISALRNGSSASRERLEEEWKGIAQSAVMEAEHFLKDPGKMPGRMIRQIQKLSRENHDYTEFLKKFAMMEEVMKLDMDNFDMVLYSYSLQLFKNVPLIEPLEYKDEYIIREFAVAIDTSGSCDGMLVQKFLRKTYNILKQTESFSKKVVIHIIQCDAQIQQDFRLESLEELESLLGNMELSGFGGTDFRPVFRYVDELCERGEFKRLGGLLYFTDGYGVFPEKPAKYRTAFVFMNREDDVLVPPWAMKVYLEEGIDL